MLRKACERPICNMLFSQTGLLHYTDFFLHFSKVYVIKMTFILKPFLLSVFEFSQNFFFVLLLVQMAFCKCGFYPACTLFYWMGRDSVIEMELVLILKSYLWEIVYFYVQYMTLHCTLCFHVAETYMADFIFK